MPLSTTATRTPLPVAPPHAHSGVSSVIVSTNGSCTSTESRDHAGRNGLLIALVRSSTWVTRPSSQQGLEHDGESPVAGRGVGREPREVRAELVGRRRLVPTDRAALVEGGARDG